MAKKYHNSKKNGHSNAAHYLHNDESAIANMPQNVRMAKYPDTEHMSQHYDDSMEAIDAKNHDAVRKMSHNYMRRKGG